MVVGSMAATRVAVNTPLAIHVGEGTTEFQSVLGFTGTRTHSAWNYHAGMVDAEEEVNTLWIILVIFVVGILGYFTGILGYVG